jgi:hypothetical protein
MEISFREFDQFDLWIWIEFDHVPARNETQYIEELFDSWFYIGKLGGFNAENLQVQDAGVDLSYLDYDQNQAEGAFMSPMHNMGNFEYEGMWGRCWFDLGTSDPIALDVLLNALQQLNKDFVNLKQVIIGGENPDWPVERSDEVSDWYE